MLTRRTIGAAATAAIAAIATAGVAAGMTFGGWSPPVNAESIPGTSGVLNTAVLEGCPFVAQRNDILYFARRSLGATDTDIWYSTRGQNGTWGDPVPFVEVNSGFDELCPTAHRNGKTFLFVSTRPGGYGGGDLYMTRLHATRGWASPQNLGGTVNSPAGEAGPSLVENELYFSSGRSGNDDIYVSLFDGASFGAPVPVASLNTGANDSRPNVRRDGLEIFFDSTRAGSIAGSVVGTTDLWTSTRASTSDPWWPPTNLGSGVNSILNDLRPSLSWDGTTLYFGSNRAGSQGNQDLYVTTRP